MYRHKRQAELQDYIKKVSHLNMTYIMDIGVVPMVGLHLGSSLVPYPSINK